MVKKTLKRKGGNIKQLKSTLKEINEQIDEIEQLTDEEKINYKDYLETLKTDKRDIENNLLKEINKELQALEQNIKAREDDINWHKETKDIWTRDYTIPYNLQTIYDMVVNLKTKLEKEYDDLNNEKEELEISLGLKEGLTKKQQEKEKVNELVNKLNQIERNIENERDNRTRMGLIDQKKVIEGQLKELNYEPKKSGGRRKLKSYK